MNDRLNSLPWDQITDEMNNKGYTIIPSLLSHDQCDELKQQYATNDLYRKTIVMERYRFGLGEYRYFKYPLPDLIQSIRENIYPKLAPVANGWMRALSIDKQYPSALHELQKLSQENGQIHPTVLILKYGKGGHNTLHQDLYGDVFFPIQVVAFLNEPGVDYEGGEFVMTEQIPRAQSKAIVLRPGKGDVLVLTTNFRPVKGTKGYYRVNMKHGVSEVRSGERHTLGIIFHDALT